MSTYLAQRAQPYDSSDRGLMTDAHSCHFPSREAYFHALFLPIISYGIWITAIIIQLPFGAGLIAVNLWVALEGSAHLSHVSLIWHHVLLGAGGAPESSAYFYSHMVVVEAPLRNADVLTMCALCTLRDKALSPAWGITPASRPVLPTWSRYTPKRRDVITPEASGVLQFGSGTCSPTCDARHKPYDKRASFTLA